ncbi:electron transport complex protein RnfC [Oceanospirillum multiglobuliferum]|uniref:Ion-translocating oxidoreductase complex subunit C n=1 Tax=Oceanospirillum multiglobuliferum TaxID=64969 RepID=A0A1T4R3B9_9GAMM|nr:electron transport complex subunit RsxC [Oceanospirillum multiglobuliferum]OPX55278.1 electron transport complex subunit RsxC [Oceanospirillum multiglobuliferum]SKA10347.1 electron transport complex protein RnfC [Oceanospirillum multiglobuliferum]
MRSLWDFHGGIHPDENKQQSLQQPLADAPLPKKVVLPLQQHIGAASEPIVQVGDKVKTGQCIAKADGFVSANIHASISGTVVAIDEQPIPHPSGMSDLCISIESDGLDQWVDLTPVTDWQTADTETLIQAIAKAGIVGLGGAGFPTAVKARTRERHAIDTLVINAAECEPYITADDISMQTYPEQIIIGAQILCQLVNPSSCLIGVEDNKSDAIKALQKAAQGTHIEVVVIPTKYPSGGEKQLIKILTGREVPSGGLPADIGVVCQNVGTTLAIAQAITLGQPLVSRVVTLTGNAFTRRQNLQVRLGTPIHELLAYAGYNAAIASRLVMGGPMMGFSLLSDQLPVVKTTNCILAPTAQEFPDPEPENPCIRCGMCEQACPAELLPQQLHWFAKAQEFEKAQLFNLFDCIECGACAYVCPSHIPLVQYYRFAKSEIRKESEEAKKAERAKIRFEQRQARLEREEAEKVAQREARMAAAAAATAAKKAAEASQSTNLDSATGTSAHNTAAAPLATASHAATSQLDEAALKKLKIQRAAAAVALKKAEKALTEAKDNGVDVETLNTLDQQLNAAQQKLNTIDQQLGKEISPAAATSSANATASLNAGAQAEHEKALKQAKIAAAASKAAVKKAEKALIHARENEGVEEISAKEQALVIAQNLAQKAAEKLEALNQAPVAASVAAPSQSASTVEANSSDTGQAEYEKALKQAKIAAAASKAAVKKAEKALIHARENEGAEEISAKEQALVIAQSLAQKAAEKLEALNQTPVAASVAAPSQPASTVEANSSAETGQAEYEKALKQAKIAAAASKAAVKKAEKALAQAQEKGDATEIDQCTDAVNSAKNKAEAAANKLKQLTEAKAAIVE